MKSILRYRTPWILTLLVGVLGCARLPGPAVTAYPQISSAGELYQQVQGQAAALQSLKARGSVAVASPQRSFTGNILLTVAKPQQLRVDILSFWGQSMVSLVSNGQEMKVLQHGEGKLYRGPATPGNVSRFLPIVISQEDFVAILTGSLAWVHYEKPVLLDSPDPAVYLLELTSRESQGKVKLTIDRATLQVRTAQWFSPQGQETWRAEFGNFLATSGLMVPSDIQVSAADGESQVRVRYRDLTGNPPLAATTWELPVSPAIREVALPQ